MYHEWKDIKIFISSTFNDMHAERDYLVKSVFPELAEWCERRKLRLIDIDLRWGITKADSEANDTIRKCLNGIDESRPFFLCFLGQRRGWIPNDPSRLLYENKMRQAKGNPIIENEINKKTPLLKCNATNPEAWLSCILRTTKKCRRIRFGGTLAFAAGNSLVYQTPEYTVKSMLLCGSPEEQSIGDSEHVLAGYYQKQQRYLLYKTSEGYRLTCPDSAGGLLLDSSVNDVICLNGKLYVLPNDRYMLACDPLELEVEARVELGFVPWSAVLFNDGLLMSDEHGAIYTWHPQKGLESHGMLAVEWDKNPTLFPVGTNRAFYFSNNRYALLASVSSSEYQIMQATVKDGKAGLLLVHGNKALTFQQDGRTVNLTNLFRDNLFGMTSLLNYKCAWNPQGDVLSMGNGRTAVLDFADGTQRNIAEPDSLSTVIDILWVNGMDAFVILYSTGDIQIVRPNGRIIKSGAFQSSTRNYLTCACGNYFCVLTKRRLVRAVTLFEEEAVTVLDKDGHSVYEDHFQGTDRQTYKDLVYDGSQKKLYLISDTAASVINMSDRFTVTKTTFDVPFQKKPVGLAARDGILYYANAEGEICTVDLSSGKQLVHLPLHRNVSYLQASNAGNAIVLVENNERIYSIQINN